MFLRRFREASFNNATIWIGHSRDDESGKRRSKRATAVLRFLDPKLWGVVDWRVAAIIGLYETNAIKI